jgi:hypothetical protein
MRRADDSGWELEGGTRLDLPPGDYKWMDLESPGQPPNTIGRLVGDKPGIMY